ncbi:C1GALT1-specific chaperone 1 [Gasterosteus aculeatus]|uniref:C1GALT1 specific chaperone 1 n=2 Tax=Gasterosteus aculeatus TaxID=69293 RepID=A0AAQ4PCY1_GASAC|nr:C1GALT1-specific chaperone 1 [Gasterosteus aculeatus aculeatus]XP_040029242.1 C1GALT1-specific chaperone 1 [Gasterosteus aculeatus aculeatus]
MLSEGGYFMKGMAMGGIFCLLLSLLGSFRPGVESDTDSHHHHHHVQASGRDELRRFSDTEMQKLRNQVQVSCIIMVQPKILAYWATALDTWSKHCDKAVFYTSESTKALEAHDLNEKDDWTRLRKALKHAYDNAGELRWFFVAQPTTFAIIENLKYLVLAKDPNEPFYLGNAMKSGELEFVSYDSGIVLSYEALKRLVRVFQDEDKCPERGHALWKLSEDKQLATCLKYTGVFAENGEDSHGKGLFNSKSVERLMADSMQANPNDVVAGCCSDVAVTFNGMSPNQMQVMMFGVYRLRPYGHDFHDLLEFKAPEGSDND